MVRPGGHDFGMLHCSFFPGSTEMIDLAKSVGRSADDIVFQEFVRTSGSSIYLKTIKLFRLGSDRKSWQVMSVQ